MGKQGAAIAKTLEEVLAAGLHQRGYTLPEHHYILGASDVEMLDHYQKFYDRLILSVRTLPLHSKELVLIALGATMRIPELEHHLTKARGAGVDDAGLLAAIAIAAAVGSFSTFEFAEDKWNREVAGSAAVARYLVLFQTALVPIDRSLAEMIAVVCHGARGTYRGMTLHLERAFAAGASVAEMLDALSYILLACGAPVLMRAGKKWSELADQGRCPMPYDRSALP